MQKDINLEELLNNHIKYYIDEEEALKDNYVPLDISTTIRSMYSNLVVERETDERKSYYVNISNIGKLPHKGYDLLMYISSIGVLHTVEYTLEFDRVMLEHSQFCPIGLYNPDPDIINPIILVHIVLSDEGIELLRNYLLGNCKLVPIRHIMYEGNLKALLDEIKEVKNEHNIN